MDIMPGKDAIEAFQREFSEAAELESAEWTPQEFKLNTQINTYQAAFAEHFAQHAPQAWNDLKFLRPLAEFWFAHRFRQLTGSGSPSDAIDALTNDKLLQAGIRQWASKYGIDVSWVHTLALITVRAFAYSVPFAYPEPVTLLYNTFPTLTVEENQVELGQSTFSVIPHSSVIVCADQGQQEWNTLVESKAQFRRRAIDAYTDELDLQLSRVDAPLVAEDLEAKWHWVDITIDRYAGHMPIRALAHAHNMSRPGVAKAIESVRKILGLERLPESWGATKPEQWELHATNVK
jgi:hypothetical protein